LDYDEEMMSRRRKKVVRSRVGAVGVFIHGGTASRKEADR
jgi:hypothetical protein